MINEKRLEQLLELYERTAVHIVKTSAESSERKAQLLSDIKSTLMPHIENILINEGIKFTGANLVWPIVCKKLGIAMKPSEIYLWLATKGEPL